jgi:ATP-dependent exoDNAse (exonuclease V) alpha subunit
MACSRIQLLLIIAYATTVHASQGATLDQAYFHLGENEVQKGFALVACSRVCKLQGLILDDYMSLPRVLAANGRESQLEQGRIRREELRFEAADTYGVQLKCPFDEEDLA